MATYYYNGSQIVTPFSVYSNEPQFDMTTVSLKTQRASQGHQRWELNFGLVGTADTEVDLLLGAITDMETSSTMIMPQLPSVDAANTTTSEVIELTTSVAAGDTSALCDVTFTDGFLPKGTFFKFSTHDKIYITTSDLNLSLGTDQTLNFYPAARIAVNSTEQIRTGSQAILTYYRSIDNQQGITFTDGILTSIGAVTLVEAI